ncbi:hypothetical protein GCM10009601_01710 [Streptomyces thermospinosisporus]|uniref:DUF3592 domain-containing protein n=1 Tax=Streptomyces thermospinosisporus TaxID=161482 RepID=A0ABN1YJH4_9ACTN
MDVIFYGALGLIAAGALGMACAILRRWLRIRSAWNSGLTAEGRCLRVITRTHGGRDGPVHSSLQHVYEFTTHDGRVIRFEEQHGPATVLEGDRVTVHYTDGPRVVATAHEPRPFALGGGAVMVLGILAAVVLGCAGIALMYHRMSSSFVAW